MAYPSINIFLPTPHHEFIFSTVPYLNPLTEYAENQNRSYHGSCIYLRMRTRTEFSFSPIPSKFRCFSKGLNKNSPVVSPLSVPHKSMGTCFSLSFNTARTSQFFLLVIFFIALLNYDLSFSYCNHNGKVEHFQVYFHYHTVAICSFFGIIINKWKVDRAVDQGQKRKDITKVAKLYYYGNMTQGMR